jgi:hypothetical protein
MTTYNHLQPKGPEWEYPTWEHVQARAVALMGFTSRYERHGSEVRFFDPRGEIRCVARGVTTPERAGAALEALAQRWAVEEFDLLTLSEP